MHSFFTHLSPTDNWKINSKYDNGICEPYSINVNSGTISENVNVLEISENATIVTQVEKAENYVVQIREVIPDDQRGIEYRYKTYINKTLVQCRNYIDHGGGPYISTFFVFDKGIVNTEDIEITIEMEKGKVLISDIYLYRDMTDLMEKIMDPHMEIGFCLAAYNESGDETILERAKYVADNFLVPEPFSRRTLVLVPFLFNYENPERVNTIDEHKRVIERLYDLLKSFNMPLELKFISDWAGTPTKLIDKEGRKFASERYQQITYAPEYHEKNQEVVALFENNEDQKIREFYTNGDSEKSVHFGGAISFWGDTPWLSFNVKNYRELLRTEYKKLLQAYSEFKVEKKVEEGKYPFTPDCGTGHEILYFPAELDTLKRKSLSADFNPETIRDSGYSLDPRKGLSDKDKMWMHNNLADFNRFLVESIYNGLEKERIFIAGGKTEFPEKPVKHRIRTEPYAYPNGPMNSEMYPISEIGIAEFALPGAQWFHSDVFKWLLKHREFGILANPNQECMGFGNERPGGFIVTPKGFASDMAAQLRIAYAMGSEFNVFYNWCHYPEFDVALKEYSDKLVKYTSFTINGFVDSVEFEVSEDNKFNNILCLELEDFMSFTNGLVAKVIDIKGEIIAYRYISGEYISKHDGKCEVCFNEIFCLYPDRKYTLKLSCDTGLHVGCKKASIGADLSIERQRSHLIGYRRYFQTLRNRVETSLGSDDYFAMEEIKRADRLADNGEHKDAITALYKADVLAVPIRYTIIYKAGEKALLEPFNVLITADTDAVIHLDVMEYGINSMTISIKAEMDCFINFYNKDCQKVKFGCQVKKGETQQLSVSF